MALATHREQQLEAEIERIANAIERADEAARKLGARHRQLAQSVKEAVADLDRLLQPAGRRADG